MRRQRDVSNTPVVAYSKDPPGELQGQKIPSQNQAAFLGYFTVCYVNLFILFYYFFFCNPTKKQKTKQNEIKNKCSVVT